MQVSREPAIITTILGSCIAVCLWDQRQNIGGMNHFVLPLWNNDGIPSPRYGNIAIPKLLEKMTDMGSQRRDLVAKVFGGGAVIQSASGHLNVGERNIELARKMLTELRIPISGSSCGETHSRKIWFETETGRIKMKKS
ncbi:MAG: chemotaxis protein CheD [Calditrichaeota bacterium]|nr:chemotaxis protein CheD [Calditrichota bacterium]